MTIPEGLQQLIRYARDMAEAHREDMAASTTDFQIAAEARAAKRMDEIADALLASQQANAALARDAARYRWLREHWGRIGETYMGESSQMYSIYVEEDGWEVDPTSLDDCIDAALEGQPHD